MGQIEKQSCFPTSKYPGSHHTQDKGGPTVIAKGQHALCLCPGTLAVFINLEGRPGTNRIAAHKPQRLCRGTVSVHPEQRRHDRLQQPP